MSALLLTWTVTVANSIAQKNTSGRANSYRSSMGYPMRHGRVHEGNVEDEVRNVGLLETRSSINVESTPEIGGSGRSARGNLAANFRCKSTLRISACLRWL